MTEQASSETVFVWRYDQPAPIGKIAAIVAELSGGTVLMTESFKGTDQHRLTVSRGNGERPELFARWLRTISPGRPDHEIAESWRYATPEECAFWREIEAGAGGPDGATA